ncbi:hypothetical protein EIP91_010008 [Steccherinum ochraceum]|uniref:BTB domain-containing protein n=1 Tax=Steccherinum ochraceum TaxID=92696 RepID=A0A4R0RZK7_9APHY|nr:hypothetical protein EIP91_010008 [Steccherinum ochraceum]
MVTPSPAKRPRIDFEDDHANPPPPTSGNGPVSIYQRGNHWFEDGNVVLVTENTAFRVYQGILSKNSDVFRDMFTIPQPADAEKMEGCPVVHLTDTKADFGRLLTILFDVGNWYPTPRRKLPFELVSTMLRLGTKYQVEYLRQDAIHLLQQIFPTQLDLLWGASIATLEPFNQKKAETYEVDSDAVEMVLVDAIATVNIARTFDIKTILPPALYVCMQLDKSLIMRGFLDKSGVLHKLHPEDQLSLWKAEATLREHHASQIGFVVQPERHRGSYYGLVHRCTDVLSESEWIYSIDLCANCYAHFDEDYTAKRQKVWDGLAKIFEVDGLQWPSD